ncbi:MAG: GDP-mannose 4,6-dehydratase [Chloroflexi bacterium]|nr:GDP-mannose 4,6-dehydratase [Chloroflexota bacterium]
MNSLVITGGAGFIGSNAAAYYLSRGAAVTIYDNLSRPRTQYNLDWLRSRPGAENLRCITGDVRDADAVRTAIEHAQPDLVLHLAAQTAVTTSLRNPREDFEINALGTFHVLEAVRSLSTPPALFYASTNKVYGSMEDVALVEEAQRYHFRDFPAGIDESRPLDFHSPYGCSKGAGDQYVHDYARIYGLRTVVFRQSTIYGLRQFGVEDQGWLAHFIIAAVLGRPIKIYGNGKQVRDMLHVTDLVAAYDAAWHNLDRAAGEVFNIGGGIDNTIAIWTETAPLLEELAGHPLPVTHGDWRPGDQPCFVSNNAKLAARLGWKPTVSLPTGIRQLWAWVSENRTLFEG